MTTPVNLVNGIGPKTTEYLKTKRVTTAEALLDFGAEKLAEAPGIGLARAESAIAEAMSLLGKGKKATAKKKKSKDKKPSKNKKDSKKKNDKKKDKKKDKKNKSKDKKGKAKKGKGKK